MSSLTEYAKTLPRIVIDSDKNSQVVVEINLNGVTIAENIISLESLKYDIGKGKSHYTLSIKSTEKIS